MSATVASGTQRLSAMAAPIACGCCLAAGAGYVAAVDPSEGGLLPCPFRAMTGLWCPGCGLTRATHHLFRGDIVQALRYHLFVLVVLGTIALLWLGWMLSAAGRPQRWMARVPVPVYAIGGAVLVVFAVIRNLPGIDGLRG